MQKNTIPNVTQTCADQDHDLELIPPQNQIKSGSSSMGQDHTASSPWTGCSQFLPTTQKIIQFSDGKAPKPTDRIVSRITFLDHLLLKGF